MTTEARRFDYAQHAQDPIREDLAEAHRLAWQRLAEPGRHFRRAGVAIDACAEIGETQTSVDWCLHARLVICVEWVLHEHIVDHTR